MTKNKRKASREKRGSPAARKNDDVDLGTIERLVRLMNENDLLEVEVVAGPDHKVRLSRRPPAGAMPIDSAPSGLTPPPVAGSPGSAAVAAKPTDASEFPSPMVGTFYRAPAPEAPPYVNIGDKVGAETVICLIEAMKVMNEIKAEVAGTIVDILVENGEAVEFGQPLFLIKKG